MLARSEGPGLRLAVVRGGRPVKSAGDEGSHFREVHESGRSRHTRRGSRRNSPGRAIHRTQRVTQLQLMAHAGRWLESVGMGVDELAPARVEEFLAHRRAEGYTPWLSAKAMVPVLVYLRGLGVVPTPVAAVPTTEAEQLREHYRVYLVQERGLAAATVVSYLHVAGLFFSARADSPRTLRLTAAFRRS